MGVMGVMGLMGLMGLIGLMGIRRLISLLIVGAQPRATTLRFRRLREDLGNGAVRFFSYGSISAFGVGILGGGFGVSGFFSNFGDWELF